MKKLSFFLLFMLLTALESMAQSATAVIFSQDGEKFWVIINGTRQNKEPQANVKITGLVAHNYRMKIIFEDERIPSLDQNLFTYNGLEEKYYDATYVIRKNKKKYVMRLNSSTPAANNAKADPGQEVVPFHTGEQKSPSPKEETKTEQENVTVTQTSTANPSNENINVDVNVDGTKVNMDVNIKEVMNPGVNVQVTETTATTTNTTAKPDPTPAPAPEPIKKEDPKCTKAMAASDFNAAKASIQKQSFTEQQMQVAQQITKNNCLSTAQVKELIQLFSFETSRLDFAKFAYDFTVDKNNYWQINDAFSFSSSVTELNKFLEKKK
ncbi:MAG: DUF4476 domain-containing protein [Cytophagaceae bacterium]